MNITQVILDSDVEEHVKTAIKNKSKKTSVITLNESVNEKILRKQKKQLVETLIAKIASLRESKFNAEILGKLEKLRNPLINELISRMEHNPDNDEIDIDLKVLQLASECFDNTVSTVFDKHKQNQLKFIRAIKSSVSELYLVNLKNPDSEIGLLNKCIVNSRLSKAAKDLLIFIYTSKDQNDRDDLLTLDESEYTKVHNEINRFVENLERIMAERVSKLEEAIKEEVEKFLYLSFVNHISKSSGVSASATQDLLRIFAFVYVDFLGELKVHNWNGGRLQILTIAPDKNDFEKFLKSAKKQCEKINKYLLEKFQSRMKIIKALREMKINIKPSNSQHDLFRGFIVKSILKAHNINAELSIELIRLINAENNQLYYYEHISVIYSESELDAALKILHETLGKKMLAQFARVSEHTDLLNELMKNVHSNNIGMKLLHKAIESLDYSDMKPFLGMFYYSTRDDESICGPIFEMFNCGMAVDEFICFELLFPFYQAKNADKLLLDLS